MKILPLKFQDICEVFRCKKSLEKVDLRYRFFFLINNNFLLRRLDLLKVRLIFLIFIFTSSIDLLLISIHLSYKILQGVSSKFWDFCEVFHHRITFGKIDLRYRSCFLINNNFLLRRSNLLNVFFFLISYIYKLN